MFMRFLQLKVNSKSVDDFKSFYKDTIFPKLQEMPGCLFAGLISSQVNNEFISLTFWQTLFQAENYEKQGVFKNLFDKAKPYLSESNEWKIQLSDNMELEYKPVNEEPEIKKYSVKAHSNINKDFNLSDTNFFVRIVSAKIQEGKVGEFKNIYTNVIIPGLKLVNGCRYVYLIESINKDDEFISLTIWDNKKDADDYEASGKYEELVEKIRHTFSQFYLWKMSLEKDFNAKVQTTEDLKVEHYNLVTGKSFNK